jgi:phosphopantetheinyl transferase (holo-ACP synthase)
MSSIGNDVVWLPAAERKRCSQPRYYQKILSGGELLLFANAPYSFPDFLWLIWSIKESVYKCDRVLQCKAFSPASINVKRITFPPVSTHKGMSFHQGSWEGGPQEDWCSGEAILNGQTYTFRSWVSDLFIYTVAAARNDLPDVYTGIRFIPDSRLGDQSAEVRRFVMSRLSREWPSREAGTIANAPAGYPYLQPVAGFPGITLSFTHHGPLVSYAFVISSLSK